LDGSAASELPGLDDRDEVIRLGGGGKSVVVFRPTEMPGAIERLDLATGERSVLFELAPADRRGAVNVVGASLSADASAYAYSYQRTLSVLFAIEGAR
jgi:hypothetical protein